jgi:NitT/TauT family transport system substrate-binding protein
MSKIGATILIAGLCLTAAVSAKADEVLVTQYKNDPTGAPFAVAIEKGFFKKAGIDVTVINGTGGGASLRAAMATKLGYGEVAPASAIAAINQGQDIKIVGIGSRLLDLNLVVMPNSPIKSLKDLKGKTFAISHPKSLTDLTAVLVAEKGGLKPDAMKRVAVGSLGGALTAVEKGAADVTAIPAVLYRIKHGAKNYRSILGPKEMPHLPDQVANMVHELVEAKFWSEGNIEMPLLELSERAMFDVGMLNKKVDLNKMIDTSFLPKDLQKITK